MRGIDKDKLEIIFTQAQIEEVEIEEASLRAAINSAIERANAAMKESSSADTAAVSPIGSNHKPRMLKITAWIAHAGKPNRNDRAFVREDLEEAVQNGLFKAPYFGMIDYNHDFEAYGAWYDAEMAFDPKAGQWGILAHGALFAWRYEQLADTVLAMQARNGFVDVSMACLADDYESAEDPDGRPYLVIRRPVFFTTSLLDVPPADAHARAVGSESVEQTEDERRETLLTANLEDTNIVEEDSMLEETVIETAAEETVEETAADELPAEDAEIVEDVETAEEEEVIEEPIVEVATEEEVVETASDADRIAELEDQVETLELARLTAETALRALRADLAALETEAEELRAFRAGIEETARLEAEAAAREARMEQIPEPVLAALGDERDVMVEKWMKQSDEDFADTLKLFSLAAAGRKSLADRSAEEGNLPGTSDKSEGGAEWVIRRWRK